MSEWCEAAKLPPMTTHHEDPHRGPVYEVNPSLIRWPGATEPDGTDRGWVDLRHFRAWTGDTIRVKWGPLAGLEGQVTGKTWGPPSGCDDCTHQPCYKVRDPKTGHEVKVAWNQFVVLGGDVPEKLPRWQPDGPRPDAATREEVFISRLLSQNQPGHWHR